MKWKMKEAHYGDIVRVSLGAKIYHFGIFVSEEEVIQFGLPPTPNRRPEDVEVLSAPVSDFLVGGFLEVGYPEWHEKKKRRSAEETVAAAKKRLGERGYDIIHNNCEHFANECAFGEHYSSMTENLRTSFRSIPLVHVYLARFPFSVENDEIFPLERAAEIDRCSDARVRREKYYAWKLLEKALMRSLGLKLRDLQLVRTESGKWECSQCCFSLSHSGNIAAVAVSRKPVGVDIEKRDEARFSDALAAKILTAGEREKLEAYKDSRGAALNALWTKKEAVFKLSGGRGFQPGSIEVSEYKTVTKEVESGGERYFITVASEDVGQAQFRCEDMLLRDFTE